MLNRRHQCPIHSIPLRQSTLVDESGKHPHNICFTCSKHYFSNNDVYAGFTFYGFGNDPDPYSGAKFLAREGISRLPFFTIGINYYDTDVYVEVFDIEKHAAMRTDSLVDKFFLNYPNKEPELMNLPRLYIALTFVAYWNQSMRDEFQSNGW